MGMSHHCVVQLQAWTNKVSRVTRLWNPNQSCIYYVIEKSKGIKTIYGNVIFVSAIKSLCKKGIQYYTNEDHRVYRMWALELLTLKANLWFHAPFNNLNFYAIILITILRLSLMFAIIFCAVPELCPLVHWKISNLWFLWFYFSFILSRNMGNQDTFFLFF